MQLQDKILLLEKEIKKYNKVLIAYSGGVDSTLLLKAACDALGAGNVIAATATSITYTQKELTIAKELTAEFKVHHIIIQTEEFKDEKFINNDPLRCYYCKKELFSQLLQIKEQYQCDVIMDGANFDDIKDYRPGKKAEEEFKIITPLHNAGLTKNEIRSYSKSLGLKTHDFPALACLSSRIPYNENITPEKIEQIRAGEEFLQTFGFKNLRLRTSHFTARIEVDTDELDKIMQNRTRIIAKLKSLGYKYITLDLEGFRSGSMNDVLSK